MGLQDLDVLVVDDDALVRSIITDVLRASGIMRVRKANDAHEGFEQFCEKTPDILMLDLAMPGDGAQLLRRIRSSPEPAQAEAPVIAMSGHTDRRRVEMLRDAGASEILAKPLSVHSIHSRLIAVIDRPRPFLREAGYTGPDRRRRDALFEGPGKRQSDLETFNVA